MGNQKKEYIRMGILSQGNDLTQIYFFIEER